MTIRSRLWILAVGTLLAISCMVGIVYLRSSSVLTRMIDQTGLSMVQDAAETMDLYFESMEKVLVGAADSLGYLVENGKISSEDEIERFLIVLYETYIPRGVKEVFVGFEEDGAIALGSQWKEPEGYDARKRSWYTESLQDKGISLSSPYVDGVTGDLVISLTRPLYLKNGSLFGVVAIDIGLNYLVDLVSQQNINGVGFGMLVDAGGTVLAAPEKEWALKENVGKASDAISPELAAFSSRLLREKTGQGDYFAQGESKRMYFASTKQNFRIGIEYPLANIRSTVRSVTLWLLVVGCVAMVVVLLLVLPILRSLSRDIRALLEATRKVGEGDLTASFNQKGKTEIHHIGEALNRMLASLRQLIGSARSGADASMEHAEHLAALSEETVGSMEEIRGTMEMMEGTFRDNAAALEETNASIEEVASGANSAAHSATEGAEAASRAMNTAESAAARVNKVIGDMGAVGGKANSSLEAISKLASSVNEVTSFVSTITGIADQTNLLALNAAIEAARAGDAGRGFAVVAEEVRKLAEESNKAAHKVGEIIESLRQQSDSSISMTKEAAELMQKTVEEANEAQEELKEELAAIQAVNEAMQNIAAVSQEQAAASTEMAEAVGSVTESISKLQENVGSVSSATAEASSAAETIAKSAQSMSEEAARLNGAIQEFTL
ncbi:MAG TPA: methyl-accepting chemotaxis protein [Synergistaceae bacterium]|nr:methyl-accepting chemotaxis protein [Synergistaceae bacterium]